LENGLLPVGEHLDGLVGFARTIAQKVAVILYRILRFRREKNVQVENMAPPRRCLGIHPALI
jgi:hypothetical protein